jgi:hypothetical protein
VLMVLEAAPVQELIERVAGADAGPAGYSPRAYMAPCDHHL